jgi:hypothetical protein
MASGGMIYVYTNFYDDNFGHSTNIKVITSTVSEAAVFVLPMVGIY